MRRWWWWVTCRMRRFSSSRSNTSGRSKAEVAATCASRRTNLPADRHPPHHGEGAGGAALSADGLSRPASWWMPDKDWEPYALDMLASVLDGNDASRFSRELIRGAQNCLQRRCQLRRRRARPAAFFYFSGVPTAGKTLEELEQGRYAAKCRTRHRRRRVTEDELKTHQGAGDRARACTSATRCFFRRARSAQWKRSGYSHKVIDVMTEKLRAVTADQSARGGEASILFDDALTRGLTWIPQPRGQQETQRRRRP